MIKQGSLEVGKDQGGGGGGCTFTHPKKNKKVSYFFLPGGGRGRIGGLVIERVVENQGTAAQSWHMFKVPFCPLLRGVLVERLC